MIGVLPAVRRRSQKIRGIERRSYNENDATNSFPWRSRATAWLRHSSWLRHAGLGPTYCTRACGIAQISCTFLWSRARLSALLAGLEKAKCDPLIRDDGAYALQCVHISRTRTGNFRKHGSGNVGVFDSGQINDMLHVSSKTLFGTMRHEL